MKDATISVSLDTESVADLHRGLRDTRFYPNAHLQRIGNEPIASEEGERLTEMVAECRRRCNSEQNPDNLSGHPYIDALHSWQQLFPIIVDHAPIANADTAFTLVQSMIDLRVNEEHDDRRFMLSECSKRLYDYCRRTDNPKEILYLNAARLVALDIAPNVDKAVKMIIEAADLPFQTTASTRGDSRDGLF